MCVFVYLLIAIEFLEQTVSFNHHAWNFAFQIVHEIEEHWATRRAGADEVELFSDDYFDQRALA